VDSTRSAPLEAPLEAWQPLTFGGVAAFAAAPGGRLLAVAALVALLVSAAVWRLAVTVWSPTISMAIARLPAENHTLAGAVERQRATGTGFTT